MKSIRGATLTEYAITMAMICTATATTVLSLGDGVSKAMCQAGGVIGFEPAIVCATGTDDPGATPDPSRPEEGDPGLVPFLPKGEPGLSIATTLFNNANKVNVIVEGDPGAAVFRVYHFIGDQDVLLDERPILLSGEPMTQVVDLEALTADAGEDVYGKFGIFKVEIVGNTSDHAYFRNLDESMAGIPGDEQNPDFTLPIIYGVPVEVDGKIFGHSPYYDFGGVEAALVVWDEATMEVDAVLEADPAIGFDPARTFIAGVGVNEIVLLSWFDDYKLLGLDPETYEIRQIGNAATNTQNIYVSGHRMYTAEGSYQFLPSMKLVGENYVTGESFGEHGGAYSGSRVRISDSYVTKLYEENGRDLLLIFDAEDLSSPLSSLPLTNTHLNAELALSDDWLVLRNLNEEAENRFDVFDPATGQGIRSFRASGLSVAGDFIYTNDMRIRGDLFIVERADKSGNHDGVDVYDLNTGEHVKTVTMPRKVRAEHDLTEPTEIVEHFIITSSGNVIAYNVFDPAFGTTRNSSTLRKIDLGL